VTNPFLAPFLNFPECVSEHESQGSKTARVLLLELDGKRDAISTESQHLGEAGL